MAMIPKGILPMCLWVVLVLMPASGDSQTTSAENTQLRDEIMQLKKELEHKVPAQDSSQPWIVAVGCLGAALGLTFLVIFFLVCCRSNSKAIQVRSCAPLAACAAVWTLKGLFADGQDASSQPNGQSHVVVAASSPIRATNHATKLNVNPSHALQHASTQTEVRLSLSLL